MHETLNAVRDFFSGSLPWAIGFGVFVGLTAWMLVGLGAYLALAWWRAR